MSEIDHPWSSWPWQTCPARTIDAHGRCRCDLRKGHDGGHRADRGMYEVIWSSDYRMATPAHNGHAETPGSSRQNGSEGQSR